MEGGLLLCVLSVLCVSCVHRGGAASDHVEGGEDKVFDAKSHAFHSVKHLKSVTPADVWIVQVHTVSRT